MMPGETKQAETWIFARMESALEYAELTGKPLDEHEGYFRANNGNWIVTCREIDEEGYNVGGPVCEVTFRGTAKRGNAYSAPDPIGQARARLIAAAPELYEALRRLAALTPGRANAATATDLYLTVRAIAETALAKIGGAS